MPDNHLTIRSHITEKERIERIIDEKRRLSNCVDFSYWGPGDSQKMLEHCIPTARINRDSKVFMYESPILKTEYLFSQDGSMPRLDNKAKQYVVGCYCSKRNMIIFISTDSIDLEKDPFVTGAQEKLKVTSPNTSSVNPSSSAHSAADLSTPVRIIDTQFRKNNGKHYYDSGDEQKTILIEIASLLTALLFCNASPFSESMPENILEFLTSVHSNTMGAQLKNINTLKNIILTRENEFNSKTTLSLAGQGSVAGQSSVQLIKNLEKSHENILKQAYIKQNVHSLDSIKNKIEEYIQSRQEGEQKFTFFGFYSKEDKLHAANNFLLYCSVFQFFLITCYLNGEGSVAFSGEVLKWLYKNEHLIVIPSQEDGCMIPFRNNYFIKTNRLLNAYDNVRDFNIHYNIPRLVADDEEKNEILKNLGDIFTKKDKKALQEGNLGSSIKGFIQPSEDKKRKNILSIFFNPQQMHEKILSGEFYIQQMASDSQGVPGPSESCV